MALKKIWSSLLAIALVASVVVVAQVVDAAPAGASNGPSEPSINPDDRPTCTGLVATLIGTNGPDVLIGSSGVDIIFGLGGNDVIHGLGGADIILGGDGHDYISGDNGPDEICGGNGNDTILGDAGFDKIDGQAGGDHILGGQHADKLFGGTGNDTIKGEFGNDFLAGEAGHDKLLTGGGVDTALGGSGIDDIEGDTGVDTLWGGTADDKIVGKDGNDFIYGGDGDDELTGGNHDDVVFGGTGNDVMTGDNGHDTLTGGDDNDTLNGGGGNDTLSGDGGTDILNGGANSDTINGGTGNDTLNGEAGLDTLNGGDGNDQLDGGADTDTANGGTGNDTVSGGTGNDTLTGGAGDDTLHGNDGNDSLSGGTDNDTLNGDAGVDTLNGGDGVDQLNGGADADTLTGGTGDDTLNGDDGNDSLSGGGGDDTLDGGNGDDALTGDDGYDSGNGGAGTDSCETEQADVTCETQTLAPITLADLGISLNAAGETVGTAGSAAPVPIANAPIINPPGNTALGSPNICSTGTLSVAYPSGDNTVVHFQTRVPAGVSVRGRFVHRYSAWATDDVTWGGAVRARAMNDDGTFFGGTASLSGLSASDWNPVGPEDVRAMQTWFTNGTGQSQTYNLFMDSNGSGSMEAGSTGSMSFEDLEYVTPDGKSLGPVCALQDLAQCEQSGGNVYLDIPTTLNGTTYEGCVSYESCFNDFDNHFIGEIAVFACQNDQLLSAIQGVAVIVLVAGVIYVAAPTAPLSGLLTEGGYATVKGTAIGAAGPGTLLLGVNFLGSSNVPMTQIMESLSDKFDLAVDYFLPDGPATLDDYPELTLDPASGIYVLPFDQVIDNILTDADADIRFEEIVSVEFPDPNVNQVPRQELKDQIAREAARAVDVCLALFAEDIIVDTVTFAAGQVPIGSLKLPTGITFGDLDPTGVIPQVGPNTHVCEKVKIYMPGSLSLKFGTPIAEQTLHLSESLGLMDADGWVNPWDGPQPDDNPFWVAQVRKEPKHETEVWRNGIGCKGVGSSTACDEFPFASVASGGEQPLNSNLRPHLRIIDWDQNSAAGSELGKFYSTENTPIACNVQGGDFFLVIPQFGLLLNGPSSLASGQVVYSSVRSKSFGCD